MPDHRATPEPIERLGWLESVAVQVAAEAGLVVTADVVNQVIRAFIALVLDPATRDRLTRDTLLARTRRELAAWLATDGSAGHGPALASDARWHDRPGGRR